MTLPKPPWLQWFLDRREFLLWLSNIAGLAVSIWGHLKPTPPVQATVTGSACCDARGLV